jgi:hypothetical protein
MNPSSPSGRRSSGSKIPRLRRVRDTVSGSIIVPSKMQPSVPPMKGPKEVYPTPAGVRLYAGNENITAGVNDAPT